MLLFYDTLQRADCTTDTSPPSRVHPMDDALRGAIARKTKRKMKMAAIYFDVKIIN